VSRREFIALLGGAAVWTVAARARLQTAITTKMMAAMSE
jgi:hypothetical protein